jgi:hypothetical protein
MSGITFANQRNFVHPEVDLLVAKDKDFIENYHGPNQMQQNEDKDLFQHGS